MELLDMLCNMENANMNVKINDFSLGGKCNGGR